MERQQQRAMDTEGILFLVQTHKLWNLSTEGDYDLFYDSLQKRIVLHQSPNVYAFEVHDKSKDSNPVYFMLPSKCKRVEALAISHNDRCLAVQDGPLHVNFIDFGPPVPTQLAQQKQASIQAKECGLSFPSGKTRILGISFIQSAYFDLVICHCKGVEIYKYDTGKKSLSNVKSISYNTLNAWINPLDGVIVLSSSATKGEMQTFHLRKDEAKLKNVKGPTFTLMLRPPDPATVTKAEKQQRDTKAQKLYVEVPQLLTRNVKYYNEELKMIEKRKAEGFQIHKLMLTKLYLKSVFMHYNQSQGTIQVYRMNFDKVQRNLNTISVEGASSDYMMQVSDNLLLLANTSTNLFSIYDTKSIYKLKEPLFQNGRIDLAYSDLYTCDNIEDSETVDGIGEKAGDEGFVIVEPSIKINSLSDEAEEAKNEEGTGELSNTFVEIKSQFVDDSLPLKSTEEAKVGAAPGKPESATAAAAPAKLSEFSVKDFLYLDSNLAYDPKNHKCFTYLFNKGKYLRNVGKKVPGLINLMRRYKPKGIILNAIRQLMEKCTSLHKLSKLFEKISSVYRTSQIKGVVQADQAGTHEVRRITSISPLVEQSYYRPGQVKPAIYLSRSAETSSLIKVLFPPS